MNPIESWLCIKLRTQQWYCCLHQVARGSRRDGGRPPIAGSGGLNCWDSSCDSAVLENAVAKIVA